MNSFSLLKSLWIQLERRHRKQFFFLIFLVIICTILEFFTVASILPFLSLISKNEINQNNVINQFSIYLIDNFNLNKVFFASTFLIFFSVLSSSVRIYTLRYNLRWAAGIGNYFTKVGLNNYLNQTYEKFLSTNSGEFISIISVQINEAVNCITYSIQLLIAVLTLLSIMTFIILFHTNSISIFIIGILVYGILLIKFKKRVLNNSKIYTSSNSREIILLKDILSSFNQIRISSTANYFVNLVEKVDKDMRFSLADSGFLTLFARYFLEGMSIILLVGFTYYLYIFDGLTLINVIPLLGSIVFSIQRSLPSAQQIYAGISVVRKYNSSLSNVLNIVKNKKVVRGEINTNHKFLFKNYIQFNNVTYKYPNRDKPTLDNINLKINKGDRIVIFGETGSGKSTFINLLLGLISPVNGEIFVDGTSISENNYYLKKWQSNLNFVPQKINLIDHSIEKNIAFGINEEEVDYKRLKYALKIAKLEKFVSRLPEQIHTSIGEGGSKLSGGQKQRLAIARAIYSNSNVIIFDEATSALDKKVEEDILQNLKNELREKTLIFISHNERFINYCERVFIIKENNIEEVNIIK